MLMKGGGELTVLNGRSLYAANTITTVLYGADICMYFMSVHLLLKKPPRERRWNALYISFGAILLILLTIYISCNFHFGQLLWINRRDVKGGPAQWYKDNLNSWPLILGSACATVANIMGDGLLRCGLPNGSLVAASVLATAESGAGNGTFWTGLAGTFDMIWAASTALFNVCVSSLICYPLLRMYWDLRVSMPQRQDLMNTYSAIVSMIVEGTLPFTVISVVFFVLLLCCSEVAPGMAHVWIATCFNEWKEGEWEIKGEFEATMRENEKQGLKISKSMMARVKDKPGWQMTPVGKRKLQLRRPLEMTFTDPGLRLASSSWRLSFGLSAFPSVLHIHCVHFIFSNVLRLCKRGLRSFAAHIAYVGTPPTEPQLPSMPRD
ncbi:hypothetical protein CONPUDRAFT_142514 [Coniophora puteana RWD-64-598 SS2]|uniref:Uncharacterized protein n=1 Tax=Coniophora puteana (strain RWD-64-598) TaxID=741705 RepID=A0A5M3MYG9_CONPW|nr:uncharacterized protein CONPUDRAFT_142514 [Coniophora puteana RWD-64-598 SS2]EIW84067.1 hypothetical protein CONPUDRAFT_142514 [Coniophora puteana RWD-64-598 SS2]